MKTFKTEFVLANDLHELRCEDHHQFNNFELRIHMSPVDILYSYKIHVIRGIEEK